MKACILTIGNEILGGVINDTNRRFLAEELRGQGVDVLGMMSVGDDVSTIVQALEDACRSADIVIISGGLGPTEDDMTTNAAAMYLGVELELNHQELAKIEERFRLRNIPMPPSNRKQAMLPKGATVILNPDGTAPGYMVEKGRKILQFYPGIPSELKPMFKHYGLQLLWEKFPKNRDVYVTKSTHVFGLSESRLAEILGDISKDEPGIHLAYLPTFPYIRLRIDASGEDNDAALKRLKIRQEIIEARLKQNIFGYDDMTMEGAVIQGLRKRHKTLALAESLTGGMLSKLLTDVSHSSEVFFGSMVTYATSLKQDVLKVSSHTISQFGPISKPCAEEMAVNARALAKTDYAISLTGYAGPGGGTKDDPVGTFFIGLASESSCEVHRHFYPFGRDKTRMMACALAMDLLRKNLE